MEITDPDILLLQQQVKAAQEEYDMALAFHEVWKPAAYDTGLHERMGVSYATQAFMVIRLALRREMLLALMRIWDTSKRAIRMTWVAKMIDNPEVIEALAVDRLRGMVFSGMLDAMRSDLNGKAETALVVIRRYMVGGAGRPVFERIAVLRNQRLAHRQMEVAGVSAFDATDEEIETFYQDNSTLVQTLLSLVNAHAYDPREAADVHKRYASEFWAGARGEKTEGHPNYRSRPHSQGHGQSV